MTSTGHYNYIQLFVIEHDTTGKSLMTNTEEVTRILTIKKEREKRADSFPEGNN